MHPVATDTLAPAILPIGRRWRRMLPFLLTVAVALPVLFGVVHPGGRASTPAPKRLGLTATVYGGQVFLMWDPLAMPIPSAHTAVLSISDSGREEAVELNLDALRMARLAYRPIGKDITFELAVQDPERNGTITDAVRVIIRGEADEPDWKTRPVRTAPDGNAV